MKKHKNIVIMLSSFSVAITIGINVFYSKIEIVNPFLNFILVLVLNLLTYTSVYIIATLIYKEVIWKHMNKSLYIHGKWYHVHMIDAVDDYLRMGTVEIKQDFFDIELNGKNYNIRYRAEDDSIYKIEEQCTDWCEDGRLSMSGRIIGLYTAKRTFGNYSTRLGIHTFEIEFNEGIPVGINGYFQDSSPFNRTGVIKMFKSEHECKEYVINKCKEKNRKEFVSKVRDYNESN